MIKIFPKGHRKSKWITRLRKHYCTEELDYKLDYERYKP